MSCRETLVSQRLATVRSVVAEASSGGRISDDRTGTPSQKIASTIALMEAD